MKQFTFSGKLKLIIPDENSRDKLIKDTLLKLK